MLLLLHWRVRKSLIWSLVRVGHPRSRRLRGRHDVTAHWAVGNVSAIAGMALELTAGHGIRRGSNTAHRSTRIGSHLLLLLRRKIRMLMPKLRRVLRE
jgi:hypothetical protein